MTFQYIGWYGAIVVITTFLKFGTSWLRNYTEKDLREQARTKTEKRMQHINESFQNIKGVKLYGWENKFINKIEGIYQEEASLRDTELFRAKIYDFIDGIIQYSNFPIVFGLYVYNGNALQMGQIALTTAMMS